MKKGCIQIYTGDGKGKTTAAFGLAIRAAGAGLRVFIAQFLKSGNYSEIKAVKKFHPYIKVQQFGTGKFVRGKPSKEDIVSAAKGIETIAEIIKKQEVDIIIMDEINVAISLGIIPLKSVLSLIASKPASVEMVLTGRNAHSALIKQADLVTEMRAIKHYYTSGLKARRGIEF